MNCLKNTIVVWTLCLILPAVSSFAQDANSPSDKKSSIEGLLVQHWSKNKKNRDQSQAIFDAAGKSRETGLSFALNRLQHNRPKEAIVVIDELIAESSDDANTLLLGSWLKTVTRDYEGALETFKILGNNFKNVDSKRKTEVASFAGRLVGYFMGPIANKVDDVVVKESHDAFLAALDANEKTEFEKQRDAVITKFSGRLNDLGVEQKELTEQAVAENQIVRDGLEKENQLIAAQQQNTIPVIDSLREKQIAEVSRIQSQIPPLESQAFGLISQINASERDIAFLSNQLFVLQNRPFEPRERYFRDLTIQSLYSQIQFRNNEIRFAHNERARLAGQIDNLVYQMNQTQALYQSQIAAHGQQIEQGEKQQSRNRSKMEKLVKSPARKVSAKLSSKTVRTNALKTYLPFPIESMRRRLMDEFLN